MAVIFVPLITTVSFHNIFFRKFLLYFKIVIHKHLLIKGLVESYGLRITHNKSLRGICAVNALENIYDKYGFHILDRVLMLCIGTWKGDYNSLSRNILSGVAHIIAAFGDLIKDDTF